MADDITNIVLLQHIHAMKNSLEQQIAAVDKKVDMHTEQFVQLTKKVDEGFEEARQHRQALQEDLEATMRMLHKHDVKLARL